MGTCPWPSATPTPRSLSKQGVDAQLADVSTHFIYSKITEGAIEEFRLILDGSADSLSALAVPLVKILVVHRDRHKQAGEGCERGSRATHERFLRLPAPRVWVSFHSSLARALRSSSASSSES
jgi:hypothetical protein